MRCVAVGEGHADAVGSVCVSQKIATYQSKIAFMISGAGDKILKRWPLPVHSLSSDVPIGQGQEVVRLAVSHNVRAHDKDINTLAVSPNDSMAASGTQLLTFLSYSLSLSVFASMSYSLFLFLSPPFLDSLCLSTSRVERLQLILLKSFKRH